MGARSLTVLFFFFHFFFFSAQVIMLHKLDAAIEVIVTLQGTYLAVVSIDVAAVANDGNKAMKTLSAAATILLPLSLIASLMGMNVMVRREKQICGQLCVHRLRLLTDSPCCRCAWSLPASLCSGSVSIRRRAHHLHGSAPLHHHLHLHALHLHNAVLVFQETEVSVSHEAAKRALTNPTAPTRARSLAPSVAALAQLQQACLVPQLFNSSLFANQNHSQAKSQLFFQNATPPQKSLEFAKFASKQ